MAKDLQGGAGDRKGETAREVGAASGWEGRTEATAIRPTTVGGGVRERVIAEMESGREGERVAGRAGALAEEIERAAAGAERAIEQAAVPTRYAGLVREVFDRYAKRARSGGGAGEKPKESGVR